MIIEIVLLAILRILLVQTECPPNYIDGKNGKCYFLMPECYKFCGANKFCASLERINNQAHFLVGKSALSIQWDRVPGYNRFGFWTTINDMLIPRTGPKDGWRVGDPDEEAFVSAPGYFEWLNYVATSSESPALTSYISNRLRLTLYGNECNQVLCELGQIRPRDQFTKFKANFPEKLDNFVSSYSKNQGCFVDSAAPTMMTCGLQCKLNDQCRSFYYNREEKRCYQSLYIDSLLPASFTSKPNAWDRFAIAPR